MSTETTQQKTVPETNITRTSINIATDIWDEMRVAAIRRKLTAGEAVEAAIRLWIGTPQQGEEVPDTSAKKRRAS